MTKNKWIVRASCILLWLVALTYVIRVCLLESPVATHINVWGVVDGVGSALWLLPMGILTIILTISLFIFSFVKKERKNRTLTDLYLLALCVLLMIIGWVYYGIAVGGYALGDKLNFSIAIAILVPIGAFLIFIGNYAPRIQPNFWFGYRIGKKNPDITLWQKTQRLGGIVSIVCGSVTILAAVILGLLGLDIWAVIVLIVCVLVMAFVPILPAKIAEKHKISSTD